MDIEHQIQQQNELVQNILKNLKNYKKVVEEIKEKNEVTENIIKEQISKYQGYIDEFQLRITELENDDNNQTKINDYNNQTKINDYNNRIDACQNFINKKQKILHEYTTRQDNEYEVTIKHIEDLNNLHPVTISDYQDDKLSEKIEEYVKIINSVNDFYNKNFTTPLDKKSMELDVGAFNINNSFILIELKTEGVDRGLLEGREETTISPRVTQTGKGKWKKMKTNKKRLRKKRTTKRNGRRKKN
jgi:hypothetical protein